MTALVATEAVVLVLLTLLVAGLLRSHAQILRALHSLGIDLGDLERGGPSGGSRPVDLRIGPAPDAAPERGGHEGAVNVTGTAPDGHALSLAVVGSRTDTLLAFLSSGCASCASFWESFRDEKALGLPEGVRLVAVTLGPAAESPARIRRLAPPDVPVVMSDEAWEDYRVPGSPYFVYVRGSDGTIAGEGSAPSWLDVLSLLREALPNQEEGGTPAGSAGFAGPFGSPGSPDSPGSSGSRRSPGRQREARADRELEQAGILPGDPRLYPSPTGRD